MAHLCAKILRNKLPRRTSGPHPPGQALYVHPALFSPSDNLDSKRPPLRFSKREFLEEHFRVKTGGAAPVAATLPVTPA